MKKVRKSAASKKTRIAKKKKATGRSSRKGNSLKKAKRVAYRLGGED